MAIVFASGYERRQEAHDSLFADREAIEKEVGAKLQWNNQLNGTVRIDWNIPMGDWKDPFFRNYLLEVLLDYTNRFVNAFRPRIAAMRQELHPNHSG